MTAIDFIARFFASINKTSLTLPQAGILVAIAAGLDTIEDISNFLSIKSLATTSRIIHQLMQKGYVSEEIDPLSQLHLFTLTGTGKNAVKELLNFVPHK
jgi:DNA-binding MarR family transcriptional regulator